jgi:ABC-type polysaccharide/polyol phosphate transport system ATPase subunit
MNAVAVQNLGKKFKLFTSPGGRFLEYMSIGKVKRHDDFWALKDISFDISKGTTLGILGQNGSGKSTLLSILAGVLYPSEGSFEINGKVSAILELGSGFHPEFSGRDNIYMYGSIMGLSKPQIDNRIDEIVRFSELGDFIDQPLRTYSSGMIVRLAFSVAVNVDADILIVDEALAVGDAIFQHRCFRKIREMQAAGKTILYVGHDTEAVRNLCTSALLLDGGRIIERGDPNYVVNKYYALIADRERAYTEGNLIEHGEVPGERYETGYDFVRNLNDAKIESAKGTPVQPQTVEILSKPRRVIFAHPPSRVTYTVPIGPGSSLAFAIGILPAAWDKIPQGVKFNIEVVSDNETDTIFSRVLQPKRNIGDRGWHNFIVPLEKYSEKTVCLIFSTSGSGDDLSYGWSAWGWGKIIFTGPEKKEQEIQRIDFINQQMTNRVNYGNKRAELIKIELLDQRGNPQNIFRSGELSIINASIVFNDDIDSDFVVGYKLFCKFGMIYGTCTLWEDIAFKKHQKGDIVNIRFTQKLCLAPGFYSIDFDIATAVFPANDIEVLNTVSNVLLFQIKSPKPYCGVIDLYSKIQLE